MGGAMTGAAVGSLLGPMGTIGGGLIGGALGGLGGWYGDQGAGQYEKQLQQLSEYYKNRAAPQMGSAAQAGYSGFRSNQAGLISQLEAMARGEGPSAAQAQMREAMDRAAGSQASAVAGAGGRGVNSGAALRNASNNTAAIQSQGARDTATLRAQEQFNAIGMLGQNIGQGRAADEGINTFNAGAQNDQMTNNLRAKLETMGLNDKSQLEALMGAMGAAGPSMGQQLLAMGGMAAGPALQYGFAQGKPPGMSPIANGNPGQGGYFTPTPMQQMNQHSPYLQQMTQQYMQQRPASFNRLPGQR